jgi:hypothetical protein
VKYNEQAGLLVKMWICIWVVPSASLGQLLASMTESSHGCPQSLNSDAGIVFPPCYTLDILSVLLGQLPCVYFLLYEVH